jgi:hypothetical protein
VDKEAHLLLVPGTVRTHPFKLLQRATLFQ